MPTKRPSMTRPPACSEYAEAHGQTGRDNKGPPRHLDGMAVQQTEIYFISGKKEQEAKTQVRYHLNRSVDVNPTQYRGADDYAADDLENYGRHLDGGKQTQYESYHHRDCGDQEETVAPDDVTPCDEPEAPRFAIVVQNGVDGHPAEYGVMVDKVS